MAATRRISRDVLSSGKCVPLPPDLGRAFKEINARKRETKSERRLRMDKKGDADQPKYKNTAPAVAYHDRTDSMVRRSV